MTAICKNCGRAWNISIHARISKKGYICPHCKEKSKIKKCMFVLVGFSISCLFVIKTSNFAESQRGYTAIGGEYLIPLLYLACVVFIKSVSDIKKEKAPKIRR